MPHALRPGLILWIGLSLPSLAHAQAPIAAGNLIVVRVGDGASALTNASTAAFLDEYTPSGVLVQSLALPQASSGTMLACTLSGTATSEGHLNISPDGAYFTLGGYNTSAGLAAVATTASTTVARVVARIDLSGNIDTASSINNAFSAGAVRSVATDNGLQFWACGPNSGVQYLTYGSASSSAASTGTPTNLRDLGIYQGQLYCSSGSGAFQGVCSVGSWLPTAGAAITRLPGFPSVAGTQSTYDWFFADANTCYCTNDAAVGGGIQKWVWTAGTWNLAYTLTPAGTVARYLTGTVQNGIATLYATTTQTTGNAIVAVTDTGPLSLFATVATAQPNTVLRGLRVSGLRGYTYGAGAASPTSTALPRVRTSAPPQLGDANFAVQADNLQPFGFGFMVLGLGSCLTSGIPLPGGPATLNLYVNPIASNSLLLADGTGTGSLRLPLPSASAFLGVTLASQVLAYDPAMPDALPLGASAGLTIVLGP